MTHKAVRPSLDQLLPQPARGLNIFEHPAVHHLDATGRACHVIDIDPSVKGFRKREVAEDEGLPPPERRAPGNPGYVGRHRGELRIRAIPAVHDGTSLWLALRLVAVEGSLVGVVGELVDQCLRAMGEHKVPADAVIFRGDGEFGSVGIMQAFVDRGAHCLVRISRYALLEREEVLATLARARWQRVRSGESAVPREATELGICRLVGSTDGRPEVQVRVMATRIPCRADDTDEVSHGIRREGYRIELFATTLDSVRWPAADLAELYMGRASMENRLQQEDRELGLGRTFSMNPAGQEWVWGLGLLLWNHLVCTGWRQKPPSARQRRQERRPPIDRTQPDAKADASPLPATRDSTQEPAPPADMMQPPVGEACVEEEPNATSATPTAAGSATPEPVQEPAAPSAEATTPTPLPLNAVVGRVFADFDGREGWTVNAAAGLVRCPQGRRLKPFNVNTLKSGIPRLCLRTDPHACIGCPVREACFPSDRIGPYKQVSRTITHKEKEVCTAALKAAHAAAAADHRGPPSPVPRRKVPSVPPAARASSKPVDPWHLPPDDLAPGPWWAERPQFIPAEARRRARHIPTGKVVRVEIDDVVPLQRESADVAMDRARRARRRRTYDERAARNRHHASTGIRTTVGRP